MIVIIGLRGHGEEHVAFDEVVGIGSFVVHLLVFTRSHILLDGVRRRIGLHIQITLAIEGGNLEQEASVLRPLRRTSCLGAA